ncbi:MAG: hypothetical protein RR827_09465 [Oscillospiraceae bacterium]
MDEKTLAEKEAELQAKEAELAEKEAELQKKEDEIIYKGAKERLYDKVKIPIKVLDIFIAICFVAIVICLFLGMRH